MLEEETIDEKVEKTNRKEIRGGTCELYVDATGNYWLPIENDGSQTIYRITSDGRVIRIVREKDPRYPGEERYYESSNNVVGHNPQISFERIKDKNGQISHSPVLSFERIDPQTSSPPIPLQK